MKGTTMLTFLFGCFATIVFGFRHGLLGARGSNRIPRLRTQLYGRRGGHNKRLAGVNIWMRDVTPDVRVMEKAFVRRTSQMVFLKSRDIQLLDAYINPSVSAYDFKNNYVAVKTKLNTMKVCLILPGSIVGEYKTTINDVMGRNTVSETDVVGEFTMTGDGPLTHNEVHMLNSTIPELVAFCQRQRKKNIQTINLVDATTAVTYVTDLEDTRPISVLTINGKVTIHLKKIH